MFSSINMISYEWNDDDDKKPFAELYYIPLYSPWAVNSKFVPTHGQRAQTKL
jgi:hypothetical protein